MGDIDVSRSESTDLPSGWNREVISLLGDWEKRAGAAARTHYWVATNLTSRNYALGVPVVIFTTFVGTSVFATLQDDVNPRIRLFLGAVSVLSAILASLQTFLRYAERSQLHRVAGDNWSAIHREITEMLALQPYLATRGGDPKTFLDGIRKRMDEVAAESPEMPSHRWVRNLEEQGGRVTYSAS